MGLQHVALHLKYAVQGSLAASFHLGVWMPMSDVGGAICAGAEPGIRCYSC